MAWGVRFITFTHTIPVLSRIYSLLAWLYLGQPMYTLNPPATSHPIIIKIVTWATFITVIPLIEYNIYKYTGKWINPFVVTPKIEENLG